MHQDAITILRIISDPQKALVQAGVFNDWRTYSFTSYSDIVHLATNGEIVPDTTRDILGQLVELGFVTGDRGTAAVMGKPAQFLDPKEKGVSHLSETGRQLLATLS